ncbi:hypothetical protein KM043_002649 [Ampulex compressa]|nr:hypothetical protein KM043_002649 [Ampulex compressa]
MGAEHAATTSCREEYLESIVSPDLDYHHSRLVRVAELASPGERSPLPITILITADARKEDEDDDDDDDDEDDGQEEEEEEEEEEAEGECAGWRLERSGRPGGRKREIREYRPWYLRRVITMTRAPIFVDNLRG